MENPENEELVKAENITAPPGAMQENAEMVDPYAELGVANLEALFVNEEFEQRFVATQSSYAMSELQKVDQLVAQEIQKRMTKIKEDGALAALGQTDVQQARKLGKAWGDALRAVDTKEAEAVLRAELTETEAYKSQKKQAVQDIEAAYLKNSERLEYVAVDIANRKNDPEFLAALSVWGRSPNAGGERGEDDRGFHAGVIHYFEYRSSGEKNSRYKTEQPDEFGVDGFIEYSENARKLIAEAEALAAGDTVENSSVFRSAIVPDKVGSRRLMILTADNMFLTAFQRPGETMRLVTMYPSSEKQFEKAVQDELKPDGRNRLNELQGERDTQNVQFYSAAKN